MVGRRQTQRDTETKGGGVRAGKEGEGLESERGPDERSSGRLSEEERKRGAGRGGSWPGAAEPGWPSPP